MHTTTGERMTTHITKTWFDGKNIVTQEIPVEEVYKREWVGLTNNELQPIADEYRILFGSWVEDFARAIEAKLKEKNA
jgi:hypothetical protein